MDIKKIKNIKLTYLIGALALGIMLMIMSDSFNKEKEKPIPTVVENNLPKTEELEKELESIIDDIAGVSDVSVFVTYDNSGVKKIVTVAEENKATEDVKTSANSKTQPVTVKESGRESPFVNEEKLPEIRGIIICAKGVEDSYTNIMVTDAVASAMGVSVHRVKVLPKD